MIDVDTPDILKKIVEVKRAEVERLKLERPLSELERLIEGRPRAQNLSGALMGSSGGES